MLVCLKCGCVARECMSGLIHSPEDYVVIGIKTKRCRKSRSGRKGGKGAGVAFPQGEDASVRPTWVVHSKPALAYA